MNRQPSDSLLTTLQAFEAMRWLLRLRIDGGGRDVPLSVVLAEIEEWDAGSIAADWRTAVTRLKAAHVGGERPPASGAFYLSESQALEAAVEYSRAFIERADSEILFPDIWTEVESDGVTSDPAAWWDWLDAVLTVLVRTE